MKIGETAGKNRRVSKFVGNIVFISRSSALDIARAEETIKGRQTRERGDKQRLLRIQGRHFSPSSSALGTNKKRVGEEADRQPLDDNLDQPLIMAAELVLVCGVGRRV